MHWKQEQSGRTTVFTSYLEQDKLEDSLVGLWECCKTKVLPLCEGYSWDYVRVELWIDSGRVIVYPTSRDSFSRDEPALCQLISTPTLSEYEILAKCDIADEDFEEEMERRQRLLADRVIKTIGESELKHMPVSVWTPDDEEGPIAEENWQ